MFFFYIYIYSQLLISQICGKVGGGYYRKRERERARDAIAQKRVEQGMRGGKQMRVVL